jgi:hypothetical protein
VRAVVLDRHAGVIADMYDRAQQQAPEEKAPVRLVRLATRAA